MTGENHVHQISVWHPRVQNTWEQKDFMKSSFFSISNLLKTLKEFWAARSMCVFMTSKNVCPALPFVYVIEKIRFKETN